MSSENSETPRPATTIVKSNKRNDGRSVLFNTSDIYNLKEKLPPFDFQKNFDSNKKQNKKNINFFVN